MTTLRERISDIAISSRLPGDEFCIIIERHLREYGEEAVREAMGKGMVSHPVADPKDCPPSKVTVSHPEVKCLCEHMEGNIFKVNLACPLHGLNAGRPTAEDALKAFLFGLEMSGLKAEEFDAKAEVLKAGIHDLLSGHRDTDAARAITGKAAKNSNVKEVDRG